MFNLKYLTAKEKRLNENQKDYKSASKYSDARKV